MNGLGQLARRLNRRQGAPARAEAGVATAADPVEEVSAEWRLVLEALRVVSGFDRGVIYDVPGSEAPRPLPGTRVYVRGSPAWRRYLDARERLDDGELTPVLALRPLDDVERTLVVDWGTTYANSFLLIEPRDRTCDLTDPANAVRRALEAEASAALRGAGRGRWPSPVPSVPMVMAEAVRGVFGVWVWWLEPLPAGQPQEEQLDLSPPDATIAGVLLPRLRRWFPQEAFDRALAQLHETERELFHSSVRCVRMPFRTRLGLPVLHDPYCADRALRRLVRAGRVAVGRVEGTTVRYYDPDQPALDTMNDEHFEQLVL